LRKKAAPLPTGGFELDMDHDADTLDQHFVRQASR
jgi:hypothetical protein